MVLLCLLLPQELSSGKPVVCVYPQSIATKSWFFMQCSVHSKQALDRSPWIRTAKCGSFYRCVFYFSPPFKCLCVSTYLLVAALPPKLFCFWPQRRVQVAVRFWWPHLRVVPFDLCTLPHPNSPLTLLYTTLYYTSRHA